MKIPLYCWNITYGLRYVTVVFAIKIFPSGVPGFATDCSCGVWYHGLTTGLLYISPRFRNQVLNCLFNKKVCHDNDLDISVPANSEVNKNPTKAGLSTNLNKSGPSNLVAKSDRLWYLTWLFIADAYINVHPTTDTLMIFDYVSEMIIRNYEYFVGYLVLINISIIKIIINFTALGHCVWIFFVLQTTTGIVLIEYFCSSVIKWTIIIFHIS